MSKLRGSNHQVSKDKINQMIAPRRKNPEIKLDRTDTTIDPSQKAKRKAEEKKRRGKEGRGRVRGREATYIYEGRWSVHAAARSARDTFSGLFVIPTGWNSIPVEDSRSPVMWILRVAWREPLWRVAFARKDRRRAYGCSSAPSQIGRLGGQWLPRLSPREVSGSV